MKKIGFMAVYRNKDGGRDIEFRTIDGEKADSNWMINAFGFFGDLQSLMAEEHGYWCCSITGWFLCSEDKVQRNFDRLRDTLIRKSGSYNIFEMVIVGDLEMLINAINDYPDQKLLWMD